MKTWNEEEYSRILMFLNDEMTPAERESMHTLIGKDPDWAHEVQRVRETLRGLRYNHIRSIIDGPVVVPIPLWRQPRTWLAAAMVIAVLGLSWWFALQESTPTAPVLGDRTQKQDTVPPEILPTLTASDMVSFFIAEDTPLTDIPSVLSQEAREIAADVTRQQAIASLKKSGNPKDTAPADKPGEQIYGSSREPASTAPGFTAREEAYRNLLLGIGLLKESAYDEALRALNQVKDQSLAQEVHWYKALAYIRQGKNQEARKELEQVTDSRFAEDALNLLEHLPK